MYEAYCRCVTPDHTEGISICNTGCGNPTDVCTPDFGCAPTEAGCNAETCTCKPNGIDTNTMTYQDCVDQCALADMIVPDGELGVTAARNTGCSINAYEMWVNTDGAVELPDPMVNCDNDDTIVDSWGDSCSDWYDDKPETCGEYDTDTFVAKDLCCSCKYQDLSEWADLEGVTVDESDFEWVVGAHFAVIFSKDNCDYCREAINFMNSIGYPSFVVDFDRIENADEAVAYVSDYIGNNMVPAIFVNRYYIGGYTQLVELYNNDAPNDLTTQYHEWNMAQVDCVNDDSVSDSFGDTCSNWYTGENLEKCGDYDTDTFVASEACCECM